MSKFRLAAVTIAALGALSIATCASANAIIDLGSINGTKTFTNGVQVIPSSFDFIGGDAKLTGPFSDTILFSLSSASNGGYEAYAYKVAWGEFNLSDITGFAVSLFNNAAPSVQIASGESATFDNLSAGQYSLRISGSGIGVVGGGYAGSVSAVPVPEPGEWALMLSGIALIGYIVRRRSHRPV
jgi:hypothetical protein